VSGGTAQILYVVAGAIAVAVALGTALFYLLLRESRLRRYDDVHHRAELESIRKSLEEQIYKLNDRLVATDERWRDVNHLLISAQKLSPPPEKPANLPAPDFLRRAGLEDSDLRLDSKLVFVLTPFHPEYRATYEVIVSVCTNIGLKCMRGDEEHVVGDIFRHILKLLAESRLVIANLDGRNPNVFYELGIAQALGKPVLMLASSEQHVPFDIRSTRIIFWHNPLDLRDRLQEEILKVFVAAGP
jgi:hypothetical protein